MKFFKGLKKGFKLFGETIATLVNTIFLFVVYIVGVGITHIISLVSKKKLLEVKLDEKKTTYWSDLKLSKEKIDNYYRQF